MPRENGFGNPLILLFYLQIEQCRARNTPQTQIELGNPMILLFYLMNPVTLIACVLLFIRCSCFSFTNRNNAREIRYIGEENAHEEVPTTEPTNEAASNALDEQCPAIIYGQPVEGAEGPVRAVDEQCLTTVVGRPVGSAELENPIDVDVCSICLASFSQTDVVRPLNCGHIFHRDCIDNWLTRGEGSATLLSSCPVCRSVALDMGQFAPNTLDGDWIRRSTGKYMATVKGMMLTWNTGQQSVLMIEGKAAWTTLGAKRHNAKICDTGELHWDDGDVWSQPGEGHWDDNGDES